jgi:UDP-glucose 4-epimerase
VIPLFLDGAHRGTPVTVFGDGTQTRDFTYVDNVVHANLLAATRPAAIASGQVVNVGAGERTSLLELLDLIHGVTRRELVVHHAAPRGGDVRDSLAAMERAQEVLGYRALVRLPDGLARTWEWFHSARAVSRVIPAPTPRVLAVGA